MSLTAAKISDTFWIMKSEGRKIGNIEIVPTGAIFSQGAQKEYFASLEEIARKYAVEFVRITHTPEPIGNEVQGYPTKTLAYNPVWDVHMHLPLYTATEESQSKRCAGYYMVEHAVNGWQVMWCPKLITLRRNAYHGPFRDRSSLEQFWRSRSDSDSAYSAV